MGAGNSSRVVTTKLDEKTEKLLLENTHFNKEQINAFHADFLREVPSGKLEKKHFVKLFKSMHQNDSKKSKADKYCDYVFK